MKMVFENSKTKLLYVRFLYIAALICAFVYLIFENQGILIVQMHSNQEKIELGCSQGQIEPEKEGCNLFSGKWVYDNKTPPLYKEGECSFMEGHFACEKYGRKDLKYQNWRWQPHHCDLPRFFLYLIYKNYTPEDIYIDNIFYVLCT